MLVTFVKLHPLKVICNEERHFLVSNVFSPECSNISFYTGTPYASLNGIVITFLTVRNFLALKLKIKMITFSQIAFISHQYDQPSVNKLLFGIVKTHYLQFSKIFNLHNVEVNILYTFPRGSYSAHFIHFRLF